MLEITAQVHRRPLVTSGQRQIRSTAQTVQIDMIKRDKSPGAYWARLVPGQCAAIWHPKKADGRQYVHLVKAHNKSVTLPRLARGESVAV